VSKRLFERERERETMLLCCGGLFSESSICLQFSTRDETVEEEEAGREAAERADEEE
jgi:hypothetical protein